MNYWPCSNVTIAHALTNKEEVITVTDYAVDKVTVHNASNISSQICPKCGSNYLTRIHRRFRDRLLSIFVPVYRYRCDSLACEWEGNLRVKRRRVRHTYG